MFDWLYSILIFIACALGAVLVPFILMALIWFIYYRFFKKMKPKKPDAVGSTKKVSFLRRLYIDFPRRFVLDRLSSDPNEFGLYGFHLFVGEQGSGKTVATAEFIRRIKRQYPLCQIATNFELTSEDSSIEGWQDLVFHNNGIYGQVDVIDEVQNWFSCNQSKDFPPEMIQEITQQRKQRKVFIGTTQRFERMAKPLREQVNYLYYPITIAGCLTIVKVCKPTVDSEGQLKKTRGARYYFFVHDDDLRNSFDTYHKIKKQAEAGFIADNREQDIRITSVLEDRKRSRRR